VSASVRRHHVVNLITGNPHPFAIHFDFIMVADYRLLVSCLNPDCRHEALIYVSSYWADTTVPSFIPRMRCSACGGKRVDVRPLSQTNTALSLAWVRCPQEKPFHFASQNRGVRCNL
jgi:hypothetical protein